MTNLTRRAFSTAILASMLSSAARAQTYPSQNIKFVVPYAPGGGTDVLARLIGTKLTERFKQNILIDNRPGGGGNIAVRAVATSDPNGYTILFGANPIVLNHVLEKSSGALNPLEALSPITLYASAPLLVLVAPDVPVNSLQELIAFAKKSPTKLKYASSGAGSSNHLGGALFGSVAGIDIVHVPYKGVAPAMVDVTTGRVEIFVSSAFSARPQVVSKQVKVLAVAGDKRLPSLPDVPTTGEQGFPDFKVDAWWGALAPKQTPKEIVQSLRDAIVGDMASPDIRKTLEDQDAIGIGSTPEGFAEFIAAETQKWTKVAKEAGLGDG